METILRRAVVTGCSGFIGSALSRRLLEEGWQVLGIDSHTNYYAPSLKLKRLENLNLNPNFNFQLLDITNRIELHKAISFFQPLSIFHLAAQAGVRIPVNEMYKYVDSNLTGFANVLLSAVMCEVPNFVYASSSSVYGDAARIPYNESEKELRPNSFYGATKLSNEILAKSLVSDSQTRARGLRLFTVYGPEGRPDMAYYRIIRCLINDERFKLFGDGNIERDFTFIDDVIRITLALESELRFEPSGFSDVVNIGGGHPVSISEVIRICSEFVGKSLKLEMEPTNMSDLAITNADTSYLKSLISEPPTIGVQEGLKATINWAQSKIDTKWFSS